MNFSLLHSWIPSRITLTRERLVLIFFISAFIISCAAILVDAILFLHYYRIATEPPAPLHQVSAGIKMDQFEKAVDLVRNRMQNP